MKKVNPNYFYNVTKLTVKAMIYNHAEYQGWLIFTKQSSNSDKKSAERIIVVKKERQQYIQKYKLRAIS